MTLTDAFFLAAIIAAFTLFAVALAWGDYQTRGLDRNLRQKPGGMDEPNPAQSKPLPQSNEATRIAENVSRRREMSHN